MSEIIPIIDDLSKKVPAPETPNKIKGQEPFLDECEEEPVPQPPKQQTEQQSVSEALEIILASGATIKLHSRVCSVMDLCNLAIQLSGALSLQMNGKTRHYIG